MVRGTPPFAPTILPLDDDPNVALEPLRASLSVEKEETVSRRIRLRKGTFAYMILLTYRLPNIHGLGRVI